jgi:hypothetical protein
MANFLLVCYGGRMATTPGEVEKSNMAWMDWFKSMGNSMVDVGAPAVSANSTDSNGIAAEMAGAAVIDYVVINAGDLAAAAKIARTAPGLADGMKIMVCPMVDLTMQVNESRIPVACAAK